MRWIRKREYADAYLYWKAYAGLLENALTQISREISDDGRPHWEIPEDVVNDVSKKLNELKDN